MSTILLSNIANGETIAFDPELDVLSIDDEGISASSITLDFSSDKTHLVFSIGGTSFSLPTEIGLLDLTTSNVIFTDGSLLGVGGNDDESLSSTSHNDLLIGLDGNDTLDGGNGADTMHGGMGDDIYIVDNIDDYVFESSTITSPVMVSTNAQGTAANDLSDWAQLSANGRYVVFQSEASNLVEGDTNSQTDIFVKDLQTGTVQRVSTSANNEQVTGSSSYGQISADGRFIVFQSAAGNFIDIGDGFSADNLFIKDMMTGTVQLVSSDADGHFGTSSSYGGSMSPSGLSVVFHSEASNLLFWDTNGVPDVFLKTLGNGAIYMVSTSADNTPGNAGSYGAQLSTDRLSAVFASSATNLTGDDTNGVSQIFIKTFSTWGVELVSTNENGEAANADCSGFQLSSDNHYLLFQSFADNLVEGDTNGEIDIFRKNLDTGEVLRVSTGAADTEANNASYVADFSDDGRYVVFQSSASNLVTGDTNNVSDVFIKDMQTGEIQCLSVNQDGVQGNGHSSYANISADGRTVMFGSLSTNLDEVDADSEQNLFVITNPFLSSNDSNHASIGGIDTVRASVNYTLGANLENLVLTGSGSLNGTGNTLNNTITGNSAMNILSGNAGNDTLNGSTGIDVLLGGVGNDTYIIADADTITESSDEGTDTVKASITYALGSNLEHLTLTGSANINATGNTLANVLTGNSGANILAGGTGSDTLKGGTGNDTYVLADTDTITESAGQGTDSVRASITYILGANLENLILTGSANLNGTGNALANTVTGNSGNNILDGKAGRDTLKGSIGNDTYLLADIDTVTESAGQGTDTVRASIAYTLGANLENLILTGSANLNGSGNTLANTITGNSGNNILNGKTGSDTLKGGTGNDTYVLADADTISESAGQGTDTVMASITYTLGANLENLILTGSAGLKGTGNSLSNTLTGNTGRNILSGSTGNDILNGKAGNDTLIGGSGKDIFRFDTALNASTNKDTISSYSATDDSIRLDNSIFKKLTTTGTLKAGNFKASTTGNAGDSNDFILYETDTGKLFYDADGNGAGAKVQFALIGTSSHPALAAGELSVI